MRRRNFSASLTLFAILPSSVFAETGDETKIDLIIIGIGAAGLSTAVSAAQNGVKNILLIDKAAFVGGHSALSGGSVNAVVPELQMKQGIKDSPEFWQRQIMETGEFQSDPVLVNTLVNNAQSTLIGSEKSVFLLMTRFLKPGAESSSVRIPQAKNEAA